MTDTLAKRSPRFASILTGAMLVVCLAACAVNAPPPPHTPPPPQATAEPSLIDVPIHVDLSGALGQLEQQVPAQFNSDGYPDFPDDYRWHVQRDPFRFAINGSIATVSDQLGYSAGYQKCAWFVCVELASCGENEPLRRIDVGFRTGISFNTDYTVASSTTVDHVTPIDRCDVTIFNFDITGRVAGAVGNVMDRNKGKVDDGVRAATSALPIRVAAFWARMQAPIAVAPNVWLALSPESLRASPLSGSGSSVDLTLGLTAHPSISLGSAPASGTAPLPNLNPTAPVANAFHLALDASVTMDEVRTQLAKYLVGQRIFLEQPVPDAYVDVTDVTAYGSGGRLVVGVKFAGIAHGTVYLVGTPTLDTNRGVVTVPDLDYTLETRNIILSVVNLVEANRIHDELRARATFDVSGRLQALRNQINTALNQQVSTNPAIVLSGSLTSLRALPTVTGETALQMRVIGDGTLRVNVAL